MVGLKLSLYGHQISQVVKETRKICLYILNLNDIFLDIWENLKIKKSFVLKE